MTSVAQRPFPVALTEHGIPIRNVWYMLLYAWDRLRDVGRWRAEVEQAPTLDALLASVLAKLVEQRLRIGLGREYVAKHTSLPGIRGRIDFTRSLLDRSFERGEAWCTFQSFEVDAPRNQIVRSVMMRLVQRGDFGVENARANQLRGHLRRLVRKLEGAQPIEVTLGTIRRQQLGRNDGDYRLMFAICELLLQHAMPTEPAGTRSSPGLDRTELILHNVFERFVAAFYEHHLPTWSISAQSHLRWPTDDAPYVPVMIPDLILENPESPPRMIVSRHQVHREQPRFWPLRLPEFRPQPSLPALRVHKNPGGALPAARLRLRHPPVPPCRGRPIRNHERPGPCHPHRDGRSTGALA